ncbi:MAG: hypothetical protein ACYCYK_03720 [Candidatus Dormibacteria bacterium]
MKTDPTLRAQEVPRLSDDAEAEDWLETHDLSELPFAPDPEPDGLLTVTFSTRLDRRTVARLRTVAQRRGTGATQLVREWVLDRLAAEEVPDSESPEEVRAMVRRHHAAVEAAVDSLTRKI